MNVSVWMLLGVGMVTVFCVLLLVIAIGNLLISVVNKFPEEETAPKAQQAPAIAPNIKLAIESAVNTLTAGKGKIESIEKI